MAGSIDLNKGLNLDAAIDRLEKMLPLLEKMYTATEAVNKAIIDGAKADDEAEEAAKGKRVVLSELEKLEAANVKIIEKYKAATSEQNKALTDNKVKLQARQKAISDNSKAQLEAATAVKKAENVYKQEIKTLKEAANQNKALRTAIRNVDATTEKGQATIQKYNAKITQNTKFINQNVDAYVQQKMNIGNYGSALAGLPGPIGQVGSSVTRLSATFKALLANPVVLILAGIVAAFAGLAKILKSSQPLMDAFHRTTAGIGAALSVARDRIINLFEGIQSGETTLKSFGKAVVDNVINRFKAIAASASAIGRVFKALKDRDMEALKEAARDTGRAFVQMGTGMDPEQQKSMAKSVKALADEVKNEASAASLLERQQQALEDREIAFITRKAELNRQAQEALLASKDQTKSDAERVAALDSYIATLGKVEAEEVALATERARISQAQVDLGKSTREELKLNAELQAEAANIQAAAAQSEGRATALRSGLLNTMAADRKKAAEAMADAMEAEAAKEMEADAMVMEASDAVLNNQLENWNAAVEANRDKVNAILEQEIAKDEYLKQLDDDAKERYKLGIMDNLEALAAMAEEGGASGLALYSNIEQIATTAFANITAAQVGAIDSQLQALDAQRDAEGNLSAAKQKEYKKLEREKAQIQRKQAAVDKVAAIAAATISTARAIVAMLQIGPVGIPLSVAAGITGAAQIASIAAQPLPAIPQFFKGTNSAPAGLAWTGERGVEEITRPDGSVTFTPNRATLTYMSGGEKVLPADKTAKKYAGGGDNSETNRLLTRIANKPVASVHIDDKVVQHIVNKGGVRTYVNKRLKG